MADVYVAGELAARLERNNQGGTTFSYLPDFLERAEYPIATTLPLTEQPVSTGAGALPPFFAGLLPEGRRLSALRRTVKTSLDDELSLLLAVGEDTVGNVSVVPEGKQPEVTPSVVTLSDDELDFTRVLADVGIPDRVGLAGAQEKASARTIAVPASVGSSDAIIKISPPEYPKVVENEQECLNIMREAAGRFADVAQAELLVDNYGTAGLLVHRFDRGEGGRRYAVEDATQILGVYPAQKYDITYEELSRAVLEIVGAPMVAANNLAFQLAMAWLLGNGDLHGKNISVLRRNGRFEVAPIYDIPSTVPYGDTTLALAVQGRRDGLSRKRFFSYTDEMGLPRVQAERVADAALAATKDAAARISHAAGFDARRTRDLTRVLRKRRSMWGD